MNENYLLFAGEEFGLRDFEEEIIKPIQNKGLAGLYEISKKPERTFKQQKYN